MPIDVTPVGITILDRVEQLWNAYAPIDVTPVDRVTSRKLLQFANINGPIVDTFESFAVCKLEQFENKLLLTASRFDNDTINRDEILENPPVLKVVFSRFKTFIILLINFANRKCT